MAVDCVSLHPSGAKLQIISICDKKSQKITPKAFCTSFLCKNYSFHYVFYIFYQIANDLVKKNETMLIVYKNKLNHFEVCNCNFNFAT